AHRWKRHVPGVGSKSHAGSLSVHSCLESGRPLRSMVVVPSAIDHSSAHSPGLRPPPGNRSGGGATVQSALQGSPAVPLSGPSSHSSLHSRTPLPHASIRQLAEQPSHETRLPSSHCSPISGAPPFPHTAAFGRHTSLSLLLLSCSEESSVRVLSRRLPRPPTGCGTTRDIGAVQSAGWPSNPPDRTVTPSARMVVSNVSSVWI